MSHSAQPTLAELRALFRLLGDLRELAHDRLAWRQRMVTGLCGLLLLVANRAGTVADYRRPEILRASLPVKRQRHRDSHVVGWQRMPNGKDAVLRHPVQLSVESQLVQFFDKQAKHRPFLQARGLRDAPSGTGAGRDLNPTAAAIWENQLRSGVGAKQGTVLGLDGFHPNGEMRLIDAVHGGWANPTAAAIWENQLRSGEFRNDSLLIEAQNTPEAKLSRREGEVLARLLKGESVKEAAGHLHLSARTVEDYVKALYRKHGVHSRGELLARFVKKGM